MSQAVVVTVYTSGPGCQPCRMTKRHLERRGIEYVEAELTDENADAAISLGFTTSPVVMVTHTADGREESWDGHRPDRLDALVP